jgi:AAA+ lid domain
MDTLRTLEILISSRTPLIAIETLEEERAEQALERVAGRLRIPLFTWTMTRGLRRAGAVDSIYETKEPLKALRSVAEMNEGIYLMIFFIDLPTADERRQIFSIHLARRHRDPAGFDLPALATASDGFSGAEIEEAVVSALYTAFARGVEISSDLIVEELKATKPLSVTRAEDVEELREWARGRTVPAA